MWLFYVLETSKVISGWVPTHDSVYSWQLYIAISLGHEAAGTMTCYPTQSHFPDTESTSPCPILIIPSARLGATSRNLNVIGLTHHSSNPQGPDLTREVLIPRFSAWKRTLYSFGQPIWLGSLGSVMVCTLPGIQEMWVLSLLWGRYFPFSSSATPRGLA